MHRSLVPSPSPPTLTMKGWLKGVLKQSAAAHLIEHSHLARVIARHFHICSH